jgi:hypothetical protein
MYHQRPSYAGLVAARDAAAAALYRAEIAVHDADGTGVAEWIDAAHRRLHLAVRRYEAAAAEVAARECRPAA